MISVQNHQPQLSGNKIGIFAILIVLFCMSCSGTKSITADNTSNDQTSVDQRKAKLDSIKWRIISEKDKPPIGGRKIDIVKVEEKNDEFFKKSSYNVSLFLPLFSNSLTLGSNNKRFVNYYAGTLIALRKLESQGVYLNVDVFDTERKSTTFENQLKSFENKNADLIVGPYDLDLLKEAAAYGKKNDVVVVSPWQSNAKVTSDNPNYIQLRPSLFNYYYHILEHASQQEGQVILVGGESDSKRLKYMQIVQKEVDQTSFMPLREFTVLQDSLYQAEFLFGDMFLDGTPKTFVFGHTNPKDDDFLYQTIRRINNEKGECNVMVYGMPILLDSDKISAEFNQNVNLKICRAKFVDRSVLEVREFERAYYNEYGELPTDDAFEGYDVMMYLGKGLYEYGTKFQYHIHIMDDFFLQAAYKVDGRSDSKGEQFDKVNYFENTNLDIIEFRDFKFQRSE